MTRRGLFGMLGGLAGFAIAKKLPEVKEAVSCVSCESGWTAINDNCANGHYKLGGNAMPLTDDVLRYDCSANEWTSQAQYWPRTDQVVSPLRIGGFYPSDHSGGYVSLPFKGITEA